MILYIGLALSCALLALIYLNLGKGSTRLYPSIAATLTFLLFMYVLALQNGYGDAFTSCSASIIAAFVAYWAAILVQKLWIGGGIIRRAVALLICAVTFYISIVTWGIGTIVHKVFQNRFDEADRALEEQKAARQQETEEKLSKKSRNEQRKQELEEEFLSQVNNDDELCMYFAQLYRRMGYMPVVERTEEGGPLCMYLDRDGYTFSFVAICRKEILREKEVEWASAYKGKAQRAGLVTTGTFSRKAIQAAKKLNVVLVDRPNMPQFMMAARRAEKEHILALGDGSAAVENENIDNQAGE